MTDDKECREAIDAWEEILSALSFHKVKFDNDEIEVVDKAIRKASDESDLTLAYMTGYEKGKDDSGWRKIETHPRDDSWYLVTDGLNVYQVSFDVATADWWTREKGSLAVNNGIEPLYWMPIPHLPEEINPKQDEENDEI